MLWRRHPTERPWKPLLPNTKYLSTMARMSSTGRQCRNISPRKRTKPWPTPLTMAHLSTGKSPIMWQPACVCGHWKKESLITPTGFNRLPMAPPRSTTLSWNTMVTVAWSRSSAANCLSSKNRTLPVSRTVDFVIPSRPAATPLGTPPLPLLS